MDLSMSSGQEKHLTDMSLPVVDLQGILLDPEPVGRGFFGIKMRGFQGSQGTRYLGLPQNR